MSDYAACVECGNDDPHAGYDVCLDCLEAGHEPNTRTRPHFPGSAALWYASKGIPVFPCRPGEKVPATRHGFKDATTDPAQVITWWMRSPMANIGLATGVRFDVVDIDPPHGQGTRAANWCYDPECREAGSRTPRPPAEWTPTCSELGHRGIFNVIESDAIGKVSTPRAGGMHIYLPTSGRGNAAGIRGDYGILAGIDFRGLGGYVVAPPSVIPGVGTYSWIGEPRL